MTLSFAALTAEIRQRVGHAHTSLLSPQSQALTRWLSTQLTGPAGSRNGLVADPVFEHKFGFARADITMDDLVSEGLLHETLVSMMDQAPTQRFDRTWSPYTHQLQAWRAIREQKSVVVSAGTGSGKTECFMVPILDDLVRQAEDQRIRLEGVQALFLYPLNALINSQRDRLSAWTRGMNGDVRFCLYKGETPERPPRDWVASERPEEVTNRRDLRASPPPMLITNSTMLEYMLVRPDDAPILAASKEKLKYIVIDEAHTYVGSMAAELSLLLRRVMTAFHVDPADVRFIATSATLSSDGATVDTDLETFLADLAGQDTRRVEAVQGKPYVPKLPKPDMVGDWPDLDALRDAPDEDARFRMICRYTGPRMLRHTLDATNGQTLTALRETLALGGVEVSSEALLDLLDLGTRARAKGEDDAFLPLRGHLFTRPLKGLWACVNPTCTGRAGALDDPTWPYGKVFSSLQHHCDACHSRVYELTLCLQCGHEHLLASKRQAPTDSDAREQLVALAFDDLGLEYDDRLDADSDEVSDALEESAEIASDTVFFSFLPEADTEILPSDGTLGEGVPIHFEEPAGEDRKAKSQFCARCGYAGHHGRLFARPARSGRDFLLGVAVPSLLAAMPVADEDPTKKPWGGRRTITFTDSRQGTARFAARSQADAERNFVRSFIFHKLLDRREHNEDLITAKASLADLERAAAALPDPSMLAAPIKEKRAEVAKLGRVPSIALNDMVVSLAAAREIGAMLKHWNGYLPFQNQAHSRTDLARWLVLREFVRRPMRQRSLETMGLVSVRYDVFRDLTPPGEWSRLAPADPAKSWADFLDLCLDFYIRSNSAVTLDDAHNFYRWVGVQITAKSIGGPSAKGVRNEKVTWPRSGSNSRLEGLLRRALKLEERTGINAERIDTLFLEVWKRFEAGRNISRHESGGLMIRPEAIQLTLVTEAAVCPVTRTLLDKTLLGHSPYQPIKGRTLPTLAEHLPMPSPPHVMGTRHTSIDTIREWMQSDPVFAAARERGAISEFTERIYEFVEYFQTAEHSAQIPPRALQDAERAFRERTLNLLSCSTTMEMGVDIGNLSGVAMNNAPPSPANFLQRVGRAGRRGEQAAISLTACRHLPHDQAVFARPDWPFRTPMHITPVRLDSEPIVRRHVHAAVLTQFLHQRAAGESAHRLSCSWFLESGDEGSICGRLIAWLSTEEAHEKLDAPLASLVRESALAGSTTAGLLRDAQTAFDGLEQQFLRDRTVFLDQIAALPERDREESPAGRAIHRQLLRLDGEYLLSYLADRQILPGYGFPTGVLPFVSTTWEEQKALDDDRKAAKRRGEEDPDISRAREEARTRLNGVASRDMAMAIREYAPGATVVLDRRSYVSRGVRLAWHLPPSATETQAREIQSLKVAWYCRACGATGTRHIDRLEACPGCGGTLAQRPFLEPAGFTTDLFVPATIGAAPAAYIPMEAPWISSGSGEYFSLGRPTRVRYRHTSSGEIIHLSGGMHTLGHALCLRCGRAEPETRMERSMDTLPTAMKQHKRLRGGKGSRYREANPGATCEGNAESGWAIKRHLFLGGSLRTDVLEVHLFDPGLGTWSDDRSLVTTVGVAMRTAAAEILGLDEREIGVHVAPRRSDDEGRWRAILLYDTASGGAGFVAQIPAIMPEVLREAARRCLECPNQCDRVCHGCLLSSDTQRIEEHLDRSLVAPHPAAILGADYLDAVELPPDLEVYGETTKLVTSDPATLILRATRRALRQGRTTLTLFVQHPERWDPLCWVGRQLLHLLSQETELTVRIATAWGVTADLEWQVSQQLGTLIDAHNLILVEGAPPRDGRLHRFAEVTSDGHTWTFASTAPASLDERWPRPADDEVIMVLGEGRSTAVGSIIPSDELHQPPTGVVPIDLNDAATGPCSGLGQRLLATLDAASPGLLDELRRRGPAASVTVRDRYLRNPMAAQALFSTLDALKVAGAIGVGTALEVQTERDSRPRDGTPRQVFHDWRRDHGPILRDLVRAVHSDAVVRIGSGRGPRMAHARSFTFTWPDATLEWRLDHGFGFLDAPERPPFPFHRPLDAQTSALLGASWALCPRNPDEAAHGYLVRG